MAVTYRPIFRYFEQFELLSSCVDEHFFTGMPKVLAWRAALSARASVQAAVPPDFQALLRAFLLTRPSMQGTSEGDKSR